MKIQLKPFNFDIPILEKVNQAHFAWLDYIMVAIADISEYGIVWLALGLILYLKDKNKGKKVFWLVASAMLSGAALNEVLKLIFYRMRPYLALPDIHHLGPNWINSSFASGHTISSVAALIIFWKFYPPLRFPLLILCLLIIWTRLYLGMHYPSDIIVGIAIGIVAAISTVGLRKMYLKRKNHGGKKA